MPAVPTTHAAGRHAGPDACPGAVRVHQAADGGLARVRLPGGLLRHGQLDVLRGAAIDLSDGYLELTSRANMQLRALEPGAETELAARLHTAGLLPSARHETVRNIVCSPLAPPSVRADVAGLDARLCADDALAGLPGRFLFVLDDGSGDVAGLGGDVTVVGDSRVLLGGVPVDARPSVALMLAAAHAFLAERAAQNSPAWRLSELADGPVRVARRLGLAVSGPDADFAPVPPPIGALPGAAGALVPLGRLSADQAAVLLRVAPDEIIVTPWRGVVVPVPGAAGSPAAVTGPAAPEPAATPEPAAAPEPAATPEAAAARIAAELAAAGLVTDPGSPWAGVTTCAGLPGCAKSLADVRADAASAVAAADRPGALPAHWIGCARGCGRPAGRHVEYLATGATGGGYQVSERGE